MEYGNIYTLPEIPLDILAPMIVHMAIDDCLRMCNNLGIDPVGAFEMQMTSYQFTPAVKWLFTTNS